MLLVSILSFIALAFCYFFARFNPFAPFRIGLCILLLVVYYVTSVLFAHSYLYGVHSIIFFVILTIAVIIPSIGLIIFAFDVRYGLFCTDTSFSIVFAWFLSPLILFANLIMFFGKMWLSIN